MFNIFSKNNHIWFHIIFFMFCFCNLQLNAKTNTGKFKASNNIEIATNNGLTAVIESIENEIVTTKVIVDASALVDKTVISSAGTSFSITAAIAIRSYTGKAPATIDYKAEKTDVSAGIVYQWQRNGTNINGILDRGVYSNYNTSVLDISDVTGLDGNSYNLVITHIDNVSIYVQNSAILTVVSTIDSNLIKGTVDFQDKVNFNPPGGTINNLALWLKANDGTNTTTNGAAVDTWADQSGNGFDANKAANTNRPVYNDNALNFNPSVNFGAGAAETGFDLGSNYIFAPAANGGMHIFAVVNPSASGSSKFVYDFGMNANTNVGFYASTDETRLYSIGSGSVIGSGISQPSIAEAEFNFGSGTRLFNLDGSVSFSESQTISQLTASEIGERTTPETFGGPVSIGRQSKLDRLDFNGNQRRFFGDMGEIIVYNGDISQVETQRVRSYLALKYGITLNNGGTDYIANDGTLMWTNLGNGFQNDIFGIGQDDVQDLDQRVSKSVNADGIITLSLIDDYASKNTATNRTTSTGNLKFMTVANNGVAAGFTGNITASNFKLFDRSWKAFNPDNISSFMAFNSDNPQFDVVVPPNFQQDLYLVVADNNLDTDLTDNTPVLLVETTVGSGIWKTSVAITIPNGALFTLAHVAIDTDGDGIPDSIDIDDDNDGILDTSESELCEEITFSNPTTGTPCSGCTISGWNSDVGSPDISSLSNWISYSHYSSSGAVIVPQPEPGANSFLTLVATESLSTSFTATSPGAFVVYFGGFGSSISGSGPTGAQPGKTENLLVNGVSQSVPIPWDGNWHPVVYTYEAGLVTISISPSITDDTNRHAVSFYIPDSYL